MSKDHDNNISNPTNNRPFHDVLEARISRRKVLTGSLAVAVTSFFGGTGIALAARGGKPGPNAPTGFSKKNGLIGFEPVKVAEGSGPWPTISPDYEYQVLIPWGTAINMNGFPEYVGIGHPDPELQKNQIGIGHDGMWFFPIGNKNDRGMLAINHEFGTNSHVLGKDDPESVNDVLLSQHAHGISVVEIEKINGTWQINLNGPNNRRIHVNTPVIFSGPVADHELLKTPAGNAPAGTVNNCSMGHTPWGTYLTCEENFNGYFGANKTGFETPERDRYGFSSTGFNYGWFEFDPRFDLSNAWYKNEENRFGWVVEIDPMDGKQIPVKRTALGRFKHEGAAVTVGRGSRAVVYMGDDERFDYIYKFVSDANWHSLRARGMSPLDHGKLYVARFNDDGTGDWLELTIDNPVLAAKFSDQAEVLTFARLAADLLGATPMDRPEWTTVAPNGDVYCTLTNNSRRTVSNAANPLAPNPDGHIIKWRDSDQHIGLTFTWEIFLIAEDTHGTEDTFSDPDGLWADPDGRLFIQTDGGQKDGLNNQMLVADTFNGEIRRLFTGVTDDEITGITVTPDRRTLFINTQHPGDGDPSVTNFPAVLDGTTIPRDSTFVITRKDGGIIGS